MKIQGNATVGKSTQQTEDTLLCKEIEEEVLITEMKWEKDREEAFKVQERNHALRRELCVCAGHTQVVRRTKARSDSPRNRQFLQSSTSNLNDPCDTKGQQDRFGPNHPYGTSYGWCDILPWASRDCARVHRHNGSGPGHEKAADASLRLLLLEADNCL